MNVHGNMAHRHFKPEVTARVVADRVVAAGGDAVVVPELVKHRKGGLEIVGWQVHYAPSYLPDWVLDPRCKEEPKVMELLKVLSQWYDWINVQRIRNELYLEEPEFRRTVELARMLHLVEHPGGSQSRLVLLSAGRARVEAASA